MKRLAIGYLGAAVTMLALDAAWLFVMAGPLYRTQLGDMLLDGFRPVPALLFYLLYLVGLTWFGVRPGVMTNRRRDAGLNGALFGLVAYGTYDLTNEATLKIWSTSVTLADMAWGMVLSAAAAAAGCSLALRLAGRSPA